MTPPLPSPSIANADAQTYITGTAITDLVFDNDGGGLLTGCTVDPALPAGLSFERTSDNSTCELTGTPSAIAAQASYTITATNITGNDNASITITVNPPAPLLVDVDVQIYVMGEAITDLTFTNDGGGLLTGCTVDPGLPAGLTLKRTSDNATCVLSGNPTALAAKKNYTVTATNITGNDSTTIAITVNLFSLSLTEDQAHIYPVGQSVEIAFTNTGGGTLTECTADPALPAGLTVDRTSPGNGSCVLTGTALLPSAQASYTITGANSLGSGAVGFPITIANVFLPDTVAITATTAQLSWTALETATGYEVWRAEVGDGEVGDGEQITRLQTGLTTTTYTDNTITAGANYYYLIAECTALGCVDPSNTGPVAIASVTDTVELELAGASGVITTVIGNKSYALVAAQLDNGMQIIDISDPVNPDPIAKLSDGNLGLELDTPQFITATTIGEKAYALVTAFADDIVYIIEITDPESPMPVGSLSDALPGETPQTELDGPSGITTAIINGTPYALVAAFEDDGIQIIDISTPSNPTPTSFLSDTVDTFLEEAGSITTTVIDGIPYALVTSREENGVQIININEPSMPLAVGKIDDSVTDTKLNESRGITTFTMGDTTYALVTAFEDDSVQIIDISDPTSTPTAIASLSDTPQIALGGAIDVTTTTIGAKTYALVAASGDDDVQIIDIGDPNVPVAVGSLTEANDTVLIDPISISPITIGGRKYAIVVTFGNFDFVGSVQIFDITTPQRVIPATSSP